MIFSYKFKSKYSRITRVNTLIHSRYYLLNLLIFSKDELTKALDK